MCYMGVSENNGTPKSSILIGFSIINRPFWGITIFGNTHIVLWETTGFFGFEMNLSPGKSNITKTKNQFMSSIIFKPFSDDTEEEKTTTKKGCTYNYSICSSTHHHRNANIWVANMRFPFISFHFLSTVSTHNHDYGGRHTWFHLRNHRFPNSSWTRLKARPWFSPRIFFVGNLKAQQILVGKSQQQRVEVFFVVFPTKKLFPPKKCWRIWPVFILGFLGYHARKTMEDGWISAYAPILLDGEPPIKFCFCETSG